MPLTLTVNSFSSNVNTNRPEKEYEPSLNLYVKSFFLIAFQDILLSIPSV